MGLDIVDTPDQLGANPVQRGDVSLHKDFGGVEAVPAVAFEVHHAPQLVLHRRRDRT